MTNIYARNVPRDLYNRLKKEKEILDCKTWVSFLFEVARIVEIYIEEEKGIPMR